MGNPALALSNSFAMLRDVLAGRPSDDINGVCDIVASHLIESWVIQFCGKNAEEVHSILLGARNTLARKKK